MSGAFPPPIGERVGGRYELKASSHRRGVVQCFIALDHQTEGDVELLTFEPACARPDAWAAFARLVAAAAGAGVKGLTLPSSVDATPPVPPFCVGSGQEAQGLDRLREQAGPIPWERALTLGERIAEILADVHATTQIAHRALLPSRCALTARDEVWLLDYGVAELELGDGRVDESGYRAPEQQQTRGDQRSDIYALAVILFELISGQRPSTKLPPRLRSLISVPQALDGLLHRALARSPEQRYPDLGAMRAAMREILGLPAAAPRAAPEPEPERGPPLNGSSEPVLPSFAASEPPLAPRPLAFEPPYERGPSRFPVAAERPLVQPVTPAASTGARAPNSPSLAPMATTGPDAARARSRPSQPMVAAPAADRTEILPAPTPQRAKVELPKERAKRPPKSPIPTPAARSTEDEAYDEDSFDDLPTMASMRVSHRPRDDRTVRGPSPTADVTVRGPSPTAPPVERTVAFDRAALSPAAAEKTEILGRAALDLPAESTHVAMPRRSEEPADGSTLMLPADDTLSAPPPQAPSPFPPQQASAAPRPGATSRPAKAPPDQNRLLIVNLILAALIVLGLLLSYFL